MMENPIALLFIAILCLSCKTDPVEKEYHYKAISDQKIAVLNLKIGENHFFGHYEVRYGKSGKDSGEVRGEIFGDTLKGRYQYLSFGGSNKIAPFVLLKDGDILKLGSGQVSTYLNIPFYVQETLEFKDSDFQFYRVNVE